MDCPSCGKQIRKDSKSCKYCRTKLDQVEVTKSQYQRIALTSNQKATLAAIRKYEEKIKPRLGAKGSFSKKYGKLLTKPEKAITEKERLDLKKKQMVERFKNIKIPMRVPLRLPPEIINEIKNKNVKEISLKSMGKGKGLKLSYTTSDGKEKDIATTVANEFSGHPAIIEKKEHPFAGLGILEGENGPKLEMIIPTTPSSLRSEATKNQGDVLYLKSKADEGVSKKLETKAGSQEDGLNNMLSDLISPGTVSNLLGLGERRLDNVAWHDFSYYEYIQEPEIFHAVGRIPTHLQITKNLIDMLDSLDAPSLEVVELLAFVSFFAERIRGMIFHTLHEWFLEDQTISASENIYFENVDRLQQAYMVSVLESGVLSDMYELYFTLRPEIRGNFLGGGAIALPLLSIHNMWRIIEIDWTDGDPVPHYLAWEWWSLRDRIKGTYSYYATEADVERVSKKVEEVIEYPFQTFTPYICNLGLRLVYRQEWRPLGIQRGETVKTIPLGPKQVEKISTKILRRSKVSKSAESLKAVETTTETSDTTKDSNEIVNALSEKYGWDWEAEGGVDVGFASAGGGGGESGGWEDKSKAASTHLSEAVKKTANKLRKESKIVVSTESESTFEITTASEIQNPNDEIPITYVFSKLQRQYEILTRLAEVDSVVFVAETMPLPHQITREWVKKHDWIIAKTLMDDSFRNALTSISQDLPQESLPENVRDRIGSALNNSEGFLNNLASTAQHLSLSNVDLSQEAQRAYRETHKEELERKRNQRLFIEKQERLLQHIRDNILHYCKAIWSQEDSDQRMLRYKKLDIRIPTVWKFVIEGDTDIPIIGWSISGLPLGVKGHFEPNVEDVDTVRPIVELINPADPNGYVGNYAIYYLKSDAEIDLEQKDNLFDMLHLMKSSFIDTEKGKFIDPAMRAMSDENSSSYIRVPDPIPLKERKEMVDYVPEIRSKYEGLSEGEKDAFLVDGLTPKERIQYEALNEEEKQAFLKENSCFADPDLYYEYLFRKEYSRRFLVETNNLILDIEAGTGSTLETFKKLHRYIDVLKAAEERVRMSLENKRRDKLLSEGRLGDPDIEKVTVVTGDVHELRSLVTGSDMSGSDSDSEDDN